MLHFLLMPWNFWDLLSLGSICCLMAHHTSKMQLFCSASTYEYYTNSGCDRFTYPWSFLLILQREEIRNMTDHDGSAKGIVFSQFTSFLDLIQFSLEKVSIDSFFFSMRPCLWRVQLIYDDLAVWHQVCPAEWSHEHYWKRESHRHLHPWSRLQDLPDEPESWRSRSESYCSISCELSLSSFFANLLLHSNNFLNLQYTLQGKQSLYFW